MKALIMIVDDEPENLNILYKVLEHDGYEILAFPCGTMALRAAENTPPDLVLLDVRMPGLDGYGVCLQFKSRENLRDVPIIFLSGLKEVEDKLQGFAAGAVDYITKPLQAVEVLARVKIQLQLHHQKVLLEELLRERSEALLKIDRCLKTSEGVKADWLHLLLQEIRVSLDDIFTATDLVAETLPAAVAPHPLKERRIKSRERIEKLLDDMTMVVELSNCGWDLSAQTRRHLNLPAPPIQRIAKQVVCQ